jgi:hypothetical protein
MFQHVSTIPNWWSRISLAHRLSPWFAPWFQVDHLADLPALLAIPLTLLSAGGGGNYLPDFQ